MFRVLSGGCLNIDTEDCDVKATLGRSAMRYPAEVARLELLFLSMLDGKLIHKYFAFVQCINVYQWSTVLTSLYPTQVQKIRGAQGLGIPMGEQ